MRGDTKYRYPAQLLPEGIYICTSMNAAHHYEELCNRLPIHILLIGCTGSGKTSFVNLAAGSGLKTASGPHSATHQIQSSDTIYIEGSCITIVDTPGLDDTTMTSNEAFGILVDFLIRQFDKNEPFHGVILMHRISDNRIGTSTRQHFRVFQELCGHDALRSCAVVFNMWDTVRSDIRNAREAELCHRDVFLGRAVSSGAHVFHHDNTEESARKILRHFAKRDPITLLLQHELLMHPYNTSVRLALLGDRIKSPRGGVAARCSTIRTPGQKEGETGRHLRPSWWAMFCNPIWNNVFPWLAGTMRRWTESRI